MGGGPPGFPRDFTCPVVLGVSSGSEAAFRLRGFHLLWRSFPAPSAKPASFVTPRRNALQPHCNAVSFTLRFGLFPVRSPLLRESRLLSFPRGTKMFQFPRLPSFAYGFRRWMLSLIRIAGCPIRRSPDQRLLAAPRGFSVLAPSFFGSWRLGIRRVPLFA